MRSRGLAEAGPATGPEPVRPVRRSDAARPFLARVADPSRPPLAGRIALVVAHPDDETLAAGSLLGRIERLTLVHVTDGAPRGGEDAQRHGFASAADYAAARSAELDAALAAAGARPVRRIALGLPDQGAADRLAALARSLADLLADQDLVLTHAYEGGHPDHDAVAFAVAAATRLRPGPAVVEFPLYRLGPDGNWQRQDFGPGGPEAEAVVLGPEVVAAKRAMLAAHRSQAETLASFDLQRELFRTAPDH
ncbi:MAG: PIG-L family deacetylase, partial [Methylobacteriaceae bacterium]|nr:PIG-L family deacetylase [Methylobacteriaceae bacterium]